MTREKAQIYAWASGRPPTADRAAHAIAAGAAKYETQWNNLHRPCGLFMPPGKYPVCYIGELGATEPISRNVPNLGPRANRRPHRQAYRSARGLGSFARNSPRRSAPAPASPMSWSGHGHQRFEELLGGGGPSMATATTVRDDICFWLYTSGSTGKPKAAVHTHADLALTDELYAKPLLGPRDPAASSR